MKITCPKCNAVDEMDLSEMPPGKIILRCEKCGATFDVLVKSNDIASAEFNILGEELTVTCPHCHKKFGSSSNTAGKSEFWRCPSCGRVMKIPGLQSAQTAGAADFFGVGQAETPATPKLSETELDALSAHLEAQIADENAQVPAQQWEEEEEEMLPPLSDKDRFTAQFIVKTAGAELGPVSFNVLEDWARSGMIPPDSFVAKADEGRFHRADKMPELKKAFSAVSGGEPGKGLRDILKEETAGTAILHGITSGLLGGIIAGALGTAVVLTGIWSPLPVYSTILQSLLLMCVIAFTGVCIGAISAVLGNWLIHYPWNATVQAAIAIVFGMGIFGVLYFKTNNLENSLYIAAGVFVAVFFAGFIGCQFHHKFHEKV